ncbi:MAG: hypothetical protein ACI9IA_002359 [Enterobacterales bacterium]|jgi:hypothetical protein
MKRDNHRDFIRECKNILVKISILFNKWAIITIKTVKVALLRPLVCYNRASFFPIAILSANSL